ncbi:MAG: nitroreductase family protein [candidate division Zixibacteria bacterium]|nr:nitroreductase family protein [candidate division Zixibacteria bacterium]
MDNSFAHEFSRFLGSHRSIRKYKSDPISQELIDQVLQDAIAGSSSSGNLNGYALILTRDKARKAELCRMHFDQPMIEQAPLLVTFCADVYRTRRWLRLRGARDNFNNFEGFLVAAFDAIILAQSVALGFESHGLGICYLGTTLDSCDRISKFLELPETCFPVTSIVVGVPDETPVKRDRLPLAAYIHNEKYKQATDEEFLRIYADREIKGWERYRSLGGEIAQEMERLGITNLAQYYTSELKYPPEEVLASSRRIRDLLVAKCFDVCG